MFSKKFNRFIDCLSRSGTLSKEQRNKEKCHVSQTMCSMHSPVLAEYRWKVSCWCVTCIGWAQLMETEVKGWAPIGVVAAIVPRNFSLMLLS